MADLTTYGIKPITLDVTVDHSVETCVEQIINESCSIDILVNNAGFGSEGAIEDVTKQDAKYQMVVNVFWGYAFDAVGVAKNARKRIW